MNRESTSKDLTVCVWKMNCLSVKARRMSMENSCIFEPITYVPFDLDAINPDIMNAEDKERLNTYHATVYEKVSPYLNDEEKEWLKKYTRAI